MSRCVFLAVVFALTRFASAADLLLLDKSNAIRRYDENGNFVGTNGSVYDPGGFDRAPDGTLYVGSFGLAQLNKLDASGSNLLKANMFRRPQKVRLGPDGNLYVGVTDLFIRRVNPATLAEI